jgi:prepilin-type N-terminal cleavage/methylation domain-containing protein
MKKQKGFTLIELMIALLISAFLMAGIGNLFITVNRTVSLGDALSQNQETGRFTMDYLTRFLRNAGYTQNSTLSPPVLVIPNSNPLFEFICAAGTTEAEACSANNPDPNTILGDRLSIVYVTSADNETRSCSGRVVGGAANGEQKLADVFWVSNEAASIRELRCRTFNIDTDDWLDANAVSIINNVQSMEFQVGLALTDEDKSAVRYTSIDTAISEAANKRIRSLRVAVLTTSTDALDTNRIQTRKKTRNYGVLDAPQADDALTFNDGNLRNLFITTIELPGAIEGAMLN